MGLGETEEDRIDMAFALKELGIKSVPINMLNRFRERHMKTSQGLRKKK